MFKDTNELQTEPGPDYLSTLPFNVFQRLLCFNLITKGNGESSSYKEYFELNISIGKFTSFVHTESMEKENLNKLIGECINKSQQANKFFRQKNAIAAMKLASVNVAFSKNIANFQKTELGRWIGIYLSLCRNAKSFFTHSRLLRESFAQQMSEEEKQKAKPTLLKAYAAIGAVLNTGTYSAAFLSLTKFTDLSLGLKIGIPLAINAALMIGTAPVVMKRIEYEQNQKGYIRSSESKKLLESMKEADMSTLFGEIKKSVEALLESPDKALNNETTRENLLDMKKQLKESVTELEKHLQIFKTMTFKKRKETTELLTLINMYSLLLRSQIMQVIKGLAMDMLNTAEYQQEQAACPLLWKDLFEEPGNLAPTPSEPALVLY